MSVSIANLASRLTRYLSLHKSVAHCFFPRQTRPRGHLLRLTSASRTLAYLVRRSNLICPLNPETIYCQNNLSILNPTLARRSISTSRSNDNQKRPSSSSWNIGVRPKWAANVSSWNWTQHDLSRTDFFTTKHVAPFIIPHYFVTTLYDLDDFLSGLFAVVYDQTP